MKYNVAILALCLASTAAFSQEKAEIEVSYSFEYPNFKTTARESLNQFILLSNNTHSKFYSPKTEFVDSINSTPEGKAKLNEISQNAFLSNKMDKIPRADGSYYVVKSLSGNKLDYFEVVGMDRLRTEEEIPQIEWDIQDSTKNVLGYECTLATGDLYGRRWNVWFTPDIPIQNGPWKLSGLPGLILEAETTDGLYLFTATGLEQSSKTIGKIYLADEYEKVNRKDLLKAKRKFFDNPLGKINAQLGIKVTKVQDENGVSLKNNKKIFASREEVDFIETDY